MSEETVEYAPDPTKAVLILEGKDGSIIVTTIYDPVFHQRNQFENYSDRIASASYLVDSQKTIVYKEGKMVQFRIVAETSAKALEAYAEARRDALQEGIVVPASGFMSSKELEAIQEQSHVRGVEAAYMAGVAAGAQQVEFQDAYVEKKHDELILAAYNEAYNAVNALVYARVGTKTHKGLKRARRALSELRRPVIDAFNRKWIEK